MANYMQGDQKNAEVQFRRALELQKTFPGAAEAKARLETLEQLATASDTAARPILTQMLQQQPNDPIALSRLADLQIKQSDWPGARQSLERLLEVTPQSVAAILKLANLQADRFNNPQRAFELVKQARALDAQNFEVAHALGRMALRCGEHEWAVNVLLEQVQNQKEPSSDLLYDFGLALYTVGRVAEAQENVRRAAQASPSMNLERCTQFLKLTDVTNSPAPSAEAIATALASLNSDPNYLPALMISGMAEMKKGEVNAARQTFSQALTQYPKFTPALRALALLPPTAGNESQTFDLVMRARKSFPRDPEISLAAGRALYARGDFAAAKIPLQEAVAAFPENAEPLAYLGMTRYKAGERARGIEDLRRAVTLGLSGSISSEATGVLIEADMAGAGR
jgi:Tfp pilus assembly protein PilF